jgi:hypothetical protein
MASHSLGDSPIRFESVFSLLQRRAEAQRLSTGSLELDRLIGGLEPGLFHLFYGAEDITDRLLHLLLAEAVKSRGGRDKAVYIVCGNYRRSRTVLDSELLLSLLEREELDMDDALSRIYVIYAFSKRQQVRAAGLVEGLLASGEDVSLVAVQQVAKLFELQPGRRGNLAELVTMTSHLKDLCFSKRIALAATCRQAAGHGPVPLPEGGGFLRHAVNVMVYLRQSRGGSVSAYLVKHPDRARTGRTVEFGDEMRLGRITKESMRTRIQGLMAQLKKHYRAALKDDGMQEAFDRLWAAWSSEQGAMIHSEVLSAMDLLLLTAVVDSRKKIEELAFSKELRRGLDGYRAHPPHVAAAEALMMKGLSLGEEGLVRYLYVDASHRNRFRRVKPVEFAEGRLDAEKYIELVREAAGNLLNALNRNGLSEPY